MIEHDLEDLDEPEQTGTGCGTSKPHWEKFAKQAHRCPCIGCPDRPTCRVECRAFKRYTVTGK